MGNKRVYIASIGKWSSYQESIIKGEDPNYKTKYYPEYLLDKGKIDLLIVIKEKTGDNEGVEYLKRKFGDKVEIIECEDEEEIINLILKVFSDYTEDEITIDFTHGKRSFSAALLMAGSFLRSLEYNVKLLYIDFNNTSQKNIEKESKSTEGKKENVMEPKDISRYSDLLIYLIQIKKAIEELSPEALDEIYKKLRELYSTKEEKEERESLNNIIAKLKNVIFSIRLGIVTDEVRQKLEEIFINEKDVKGIAKIFLVSIKKELEKIKQALNSNNIYERQKNLGIYMWKKGNYQLALALIREAYITKHITQEEGEKLEIIYNKEKREKVEKEKNPFGKGSNLESVAELRNALEHAFTIKNHWRALDSNFPECLKFDKDKLEEKLNSILKGFEDGNKNS